MASANNLKLISNAVQNLIANGNLTSTGYPSAYAITNIYPMMRHCFTDKAAHILHKKVRNLMNQRIEGYDYEPIMDTLGKLGVKKAELAYNSGKAAPKRVFDMVMYFGSTCNQDEIGLAVQKISSCINELAEKESITGTLVPLSIIELARETIERRFVVMSYLAVKHSHEPQVKLDHEDMLFPEGGIPKNVGDQK